MSNGETPPKAIPIPTAARRMGLNCDQIRRLIRKGALGTVRFPGLRTTVLEADVERLVAESVRPAHTGPGGPGAPA